MLQSSDTYETELLGSLSRDHLWETNRRIAEWVRLSGSKEERTAFEYVRQQLDAYGLRTTWLEHPALVSYPLEASLEAVDAAGHTLAQYKCLSHAFAASVENLQAECIDLGSGGTAGETTKIQGKVVLRDGLATPTAVYAAEQAGSIGEIFVNDDHLHNMIVTTIWGTPTPQSAERMPETPVVSITTADGRDLRARIAAGNARVRMHTRVFKEWQTTPIVVGELDGQNSDDFVVFSGHLDSWDYGAMDNGSANATMLEVGRLLALRKDRMYRGIRIAFWSGHSHGRYSGSTWYADHYWEELYDRCVAHVNVDSTGARGATFYGSFPAHLELGHLGADVIAEHTGQKARPYWMPRAGDMSFNGIGIPALFMELSQVPTGDTEASQVTMYSGESTGGEMPWWWHTSEDTIDKVDLDVLERDTRVYVSTLVRLCYRAMLPMDFRPVVGEIQRELADLQKAAGEHLDLALLRERTAVMASRVSELVERAAAARVPNEVALTNRQIKALSRVLIPVLHTQAGNFDHDPAWDIPLLPGLQTARRLPGLDPQSDEYRLLKTQLVRNSNAVAFALRQALRIFTHPD